MVRFRKTAHATAVLAAAGLAAVGLGACEDEVAYDTGFESPRLVIDAWLTDQPGEQTIYVTETQSFLDAGNPPGVTGAEVRVCRSGTEECISFVERGGGAYAHVVGFGESPFAVGGSYTLTVSAPPSTGSGQAAVRTATATTTVARTATIDSIGFLFEEEQIGLDSGVYAQLFAVDPRGPGDFYYVRTVLNDTLLNTIDEFVLVADAAFTPGTVTDGIPFIFPIRFAINRQDSADGFRPLAVGDTVYSEVRSLSPEAFFYLDEARTQIQNGEAQLFSLPVANVTGNVRDAGGEAVLGFFNVSAVVGAGRRFGG